MQWFPWNWFSNMQFIGAGGFSAVYGAHMSPPYDIEPVKVSLKVVDEKILNEVGCGICACSWNKACEKGLKCLFVRSQYNPKHFYHFYSKA